MSIPGIYGYIRDGASTAWHLTADPGTEHPVTLCGKVMDDPHRLNPAPIEAEACAMCRAVADGRRRV